MINSLARQAGLFVTFSHYHPSPVKRTSLLQYKINLNYKNFMIQALDNLN